MLGLFPVGMTFGLLGYQQGLSFWAVLGFSALVYAGSSQFVALGLIAENLATPLNVFLTVWLVNLRHLILSLAYLPNTRTWSWIKKIGFYPLLTDETFAVLSITPEIKSEPRSAWLTTLLVYLCWNLSTVVGYGFGEMIPDSRPLGLDFALSAMFLGILILFIQKREHILTFILSVSLTFVFYFIFSWGRASIIIAAVLASILGSVVEWKRTSR